MPEGKIIHLADYTEPDTKPDTKSDTKSGAEPNTPLALTGDLDAHNITILKLDDLHLIGPKIIAKPTTPSDLKSITLDRIIKNFRVG